MTDIKDQLQLKVDEVNNQLHQSLEKIAQMENQLPEITSSDKVPKKRPRSRKKEPTKDEPSPEKPENPEKRVIRLSSQIKPQLKISVKISFNCRQHHE